MAFIVTSHGDFVKKKIRMPLAAPVFSSAYLLDRFLILVYILVFIKVKSYHRILGNIVLLKHGLAITT